MHPSLPPPEGTQLQHITFTSTQLYRTHPPSLEWINSYRNDLQSLEATNPSSLLFSLLVQSSQWQFKAYILSSPFWHFIHTFWAFTTSTMELWMWNFFKKTSSWFLLYSTYMASVLLLIAILRCQLCDCLLLLFPVAVSDTALYQQQADTCANQHISMQHSEPQC